jgi:transglutaminase-like putative cysteine protease/uncharacterized protein (DUF58 family)
MTSLDQRGTDRRPGSAERHPARATVARARPVGWSPGTGTLLGAWLASAAIARLTGASAVVLLLAATLVGLVFEIVLGWWAIRAVRVRSIMAPPHTTVDEDCTLLVAIDGPPGTVGRVSIADVTGEEVACTVGGPNAPLVVRFDRPGIVTTLTARVEVAGPAGLIWWRRSTTRTVDGIHVAPVAVGPLVDTDSAAVPTDGSAAARRGNHGGEIDGVRPWRPGDATGSVHWPSSLRADELIVHDRLATGDRHWIVDLDRSASAPDAARLRWTLDEGRRRGHAVSVRTADGVLHRVDDGDAAAVWSAVAAQRAADVSTPAGSGASRLGGILQRRITLPPSTVETTSEITGTARWSAAAAAFAGMGMLVGALDGSSTELALVFAAVAVGAFVSLWVARRSGRRPLAMQVAIVGAVLIALGVIAVQASGVDGLLAALRGPLPDVLMLLVVLHGFETVDRRTLRVHLAITFVLTSYAAGLRIDGALGWWLAAWAAPFVVALVSTARPGVGRPLVGRPTPPADGAVVHRSLGGGARTLGILAACGVCTLALLSVVPIPDGPARLGLPALSVDGRTVSSPGGLAAPDGSSTTTGDATDRGSIGGVVGYPGFTETLDTSIRGDLGDDIVMRVRAPEPAFWRGQTFTEFDGRTWTVSSDPGTLRSGPVIDVPPTIGDSIDRYAPTTELVQTYFVEQDLPNVVFAAARPAQLIFDGSVWTRPDGALRSDVTLTAGSVYTVVSERPLVDADILRSQGDLGAFFARFRDAVDTDELDAFLDVPASTTERTIELAGELRAATTYDTILAYESWLGANTEYDLDAPVPEEGADAVDDYLFESRRGFCEQIASALTIMLRTQGVPARLATGYVAGERDRVSGVWKVRASDAHAWVEVWFPQTGWQAFDPTADVPLAADAGGGTIGGDLIGAALSSVASHRAEVVLVAIAAIAAILILRAIAAARYRRRRGRWGLLQDRFSVLPRPDPARTEAGASAVRTNRHIAASLDAAMTGEAASLVADELDRAAFDPDWVDDDERFERARSALETLERSR